MFKKWNMKARMLGMICTVVVIAFAVTIGFVSIRAGNMAKKEALDKAEETAYRYGGGVKAELEVAMDAARTLAQVFEGMKATGPPDREAMSRILKQVLDRNPGFLGVWTCWEPNALDGRDTEFAGKEGHDATGRFIPYWNRGAGTAVLEPLVGYDTPGAGDYYLLSQKTGKETVIDPYSYVVGGKETFLTTLVAPIEMEGKVVGVAGIDISLASFTGLVSKIKPFETGNAALIAHNGIYAAHPEAERTGKDVGTSEIWNKAKQAIRAGNLFSEVDYSIALKTSVQRIIVPVQIGYTETPWGFLVNIPMDKVLEDAHDIVLWAIIIGVLSLTALTVVVFFIAKGIADPMNRIIEGLGDGAGQVASAAGEVSSASQALASGASEQAASIEETSSALEEMSSMTKRSSESAVQADVLMQEANRVAGEANTSMNDLTEAMDEISQASRETSKIIKTIDEIAFQTNLLALNAAVEAARAGEAGAGFAVVADEVRNLAMRAATAAKNTASLIEGTLKKVEGGSALVGKTSHAFGTVLNSSVKVGELVGEIAAASREQSEGIDQVNKSVAEMEKVIQSNAASAEESASASEELNAQAEQMKGMVKELVTIVRGTGGRIATTGPTSSPKKETLHHPAPAVQKQHAPRQLPKLDDTF